MNAFTDIDSSLTTASEGVVTEKSIWDSPVPESAPGVDFSGFAMVRGESKTARSKVTTPRSLSTFSILKIV